MVWNPTIGAKPSTKRSGTRRITVVVGRPSRLGVGAFSSSMNGESAAKLEPLDTFAQRGSSDAEEARRLDLIALGFQQRLADQFALDGRNQRILSVGSSPSK